MSDFDVVVIGGGPAGLYAGLTAATKGLKVAIFEEHESIGLPRHDPGWLMECQFSGSLIRALGRSVPWRRAKEYRVLNAESGEVLEKTAPGGYLVRRDLLEKEIAALAIRAGAELYLRAKVTGFVRKDGRVEGVETASEEIPVAKAGVFICADGIRSAAGGFAFKEGMCQKGDVKAGVSHLLANAEVTGGIIEHCISAEDLLNNRCFFTHRDNASFTGFPSIAGYRELKERNDNVVSRKIKNAYPIELSGHTRARAGKYARYFPKMVRDNVVFIGDASGGAGNIHGMIQGKFAGTVAAAALGEHDTSEKRLTEYQDMVRNTLVKAPFCWMSARQDFGTFNAWFREFESVTMGIEAREVPPTR